MTAMKTLIVSTNAAPAAVSGLASEFGVRACDPGGIAALGALYSTAYPPGVACATLDEAETDIHATVSGEYGHCSATHPRSSNAAGASAG